MGNKWFTEENILAYIAFSLKYTKDVVVVYVVDTIHAKNIEVRNRLNTIKALEKATKQGEEVISNVHQKCVELFSLEENRKLVFATWKDIDSDLRYKQKQTFVRQYFINNKMFQDTILGMVREKVVKEDRVFSENDIEIMAEYFIDELPECLARVPIKNIICDAWLYPKENQFSRLIEEIQKGNVFKEIKENCIDTENKLLVVAEVLSSPKI